MQISDLLIQYQNNLASGSEVTTGTKGIEELVETVKQLKAGNIFEGTVNSIKGNQVILGLSSGQNITARLDKGIALTQGQSVFFQVKSNEGNQVQIKPISMQGFSGNPTLTQALDAANLPVSEKNLNMVNAMIKEQMSIDAKSLQEMSRALLQTGGASPSTVVEMTKLQIPLTAGNIAQFENYKEDQGQVIRQMDQLVDEVASLFEQPDLTLEEGIALNRDIISFFVEKQGENGEQQPIDVDPKGVPVEGEIVQNAVASKLSDGAQLQPQEAGILSLRTAAFTQELLPMEEYPQGTVGATLDPQTMKELQIKLSEFPQFIKENPQYFDEQGQWKPDTKISNFMDDLANFFSQAMPTLKKESVMELLAGKGYRQLTAKMKR